MTSSSSDLLASINNQVEWDYANTEVNLREVRAARSELDNFKKGSKLWQTVLQTDDWKPVIKQRFSEADMELQLKHDGYAAKLALAVSKLQIEVATLQDSHNARLKRKSQIAAQVCSGLGWLQWHGR